MWAQAVIVFLGGGVGAMTREFCMLLLGQDSSSFPLDIFVANILASFLLGLMFGLHRSRRVSDEFMLLIGTGFTGGMSTFSSFIYGAYSEMVDPGHVAISIFYVLASLVVGYCATWLGLQVTTRLRRA